MIQQLVFPQLGLPLPPQPHLTPESMMMMRMMAMSSMMQRPPLAPAALAPPLNTTLRPPPGLFDDVGEEELPYSALAGSPQKREVSLQGAGGTHPPTPLFLAQHLAKESQPCQPPPGLGTQSATALPLRSGEAANCVITFGDSPSGPGPQGWQGSPRSGQRAGAAGRWFCSSTREGNQQGGCRKQQLRGGANFGHGGSGGANRRPPRGGGVVPIVVPGVGFVRPPPGLGGH